MWQVAKSTESFSKASLNLFNKFNIMFCHRRPNNTILLYNWAHINNKSTDKEVYTSPDENDRRIQFAVWWALDTSSDIYWVDDKLDSIVTPRSRQWVTAGSTYQCRPLCTTSKAVTTGVVLGVRTPPKFQGKIRHTKTDLLLVTKFARGVEPTVSRFVVKTVFMPSTSL